MYGFGDEAQKEPRHLLHVFAEGAAFAAYQQGSVAHDVPVKHGGDDGDDEGSDAEGAHVAVVEPEVQAGVSGQGTEGNGENGDGPGQLAGFDLEGLLLPGGEDTGGEQDVGRFHRAEVFAGVERAVPERGHAGAGAADSGNERRLPVPVSEREQPRVWHLVAI